MSALWTAGDLAAAAGGRLVGGRDEEAVTGVSIDSRTVAPADAFVAIRGDRFDGHDYAAAALAAGAAVAVVSEDRAPAGAGPLVVVSDDPLAALERIGAAARARVAGQVVAVTGSVGKTGTTAMLKLAFSALGATHAPVGSFNNHWGVPLTLARMPRETAFGIFEIGMNHSGEIRPLTKLVRPHAAIVTTVEPVHLAHFAGEADIADAKAEIFEGLEPGGTAIINRDNRWSERLAEAAHSCGVRLRSFGESPDADVRLMRVDLRPDHSLMDVAIGEQRVACRIGAPGRHLVQNALSALAAAHALGAGLDAFAAALADFRAPAGRGERAQLAHPDGPFTLIDESYNANPASMRAALALLAQAEPGRGGRRIAVLGDMLELGARSAAMHADMADAVETSGADFTFLAGPDMAALWERLPETRRGSYANDAAMLEPILAEAIGPGDVVMVKASKGTGLGPVVAALKKRFAAELKSGAGERG